MLNLSKHEGLHNSLRQMTIYDVALQQMTMNDNRMTISVVAQQHMTNDLFGIQFSESSDPKSQILNLKS